MQDNIIPCPREIMANKRFQKRGH